MTNKPTNISCIVHRNTCKYAEQRTGKQVKNMTEEAKPFLTRDAYA